ncbi:MAG: 50S ribosome-binding GTPase [Planctomycetes bacterium]|nr:50S ribosome-binding GTPase [Planctomycetota bacterium]
MKFELLTSKNIGAISVFSLKGKSSEISEFIRKNWRISIASGFKQVENIEVGAILYGFVVENSDIVDEALLLRVAEKVLELHVHGGIGVVERITSLLKSHGYDEISDEINELTRLFVDARTENEAKLILSQRDLLQNTATKLIRSMKTLDFEEIDNIAKHVRKNSQLLAYLKTPPIVFLLGKPNVGKSTLFNILAGFDRVITSEQSGTTRDVISQIVNINGWSIRLSDAAGVRKTDDYIEKRSVIRSLRKVKEAGLVIFMLDSSTNLSDEEKQILTEIEKHQHMKIANKADIGTSKFNNIPNVIQISAKTGDGIAELKSEIIKKLKFTEIVDNTTLPIAPISPDFLNKLTKTRDTIQLRKISEILYNISKYINIDVI